MWSSNKTANHGSSRQALGLPVLITMAARRLPHARILRDPARPLPPKLLVSMAHSPLQLTQVQPHPQSILSADFDEWPPTRPPMTPHKPSWTFNPPIVTPALSSSRGGWSPAPSPCGRTPRAYVAEEPLKGFPEPSVAFFRVRSRLRRG